MKLDNTNQKPETHGSSSLLVSIGLHGNKLINRNTDMIQLLF